MSDEGVPSPFPAPRALLRTLFAAVVGPTLADTWVVRVVEFALDAALADARRLSSQHPGANVVASEAFRDAFLYHDPERSAWDELTFHETQDLQEAWDCPHFADYQLGEALEATLLWRGLIQWGQDHRDDAARVLTALGMPPAETAAHSGAHLGTVLAFTLYPLVADDFPVGCEFVKRPEWIVAEAAADAALFRPSPRPAGEQRSAGLSPAISSSLGLSSSGGVPSTPPAVVRRAKRLSVPEDQPLADGDGAEAPSAPPQQSRRKQPPPPPASGEAAAPARRGAAAKRTSSTSNSSGVAPATQRPARSRVVEAPPPPPHGSIPSDAIDVDDDTDANGLRTADGELLITADAVPYLMRTAPSRLPHEVIAAHRQAIPLCDAFELENHYTVGELRAFVNSDPSKQADAPRPTSRQRKSDLIDAILAKFAESRFAALSEPTEVL